MYKKYVGITLVSMLIVGSFVSLVSPITPVAAQTGWDFQCHTYTHPHLTRLSTSQIASEIQKVNDAFQAHGLPIPEHHAYPYGDYNDTVINIVKQYRKSGRTVSDIMETYPVPDWYQLKAAEIRGNTDWATIQGWIDNAITAKGLLPIFTHRVTTPAQQYGCTPATLTQLCDYLVEKQNLGQLSVMTMAQAYNGFTGNKAVVVLQFDDGWKTDYTTAWPILKQRGLAGTSFIYTQAIDGNWYDSMNWTNVKEMYETPVTTPTPITLTTTITTTIVLAVVTLLAIYILKIRKPRIPKTKINTQQ